MPDSAAALSSFARFRVSRLSRFIAGYVGAPEQVRRNVFEYVDAFQAESIPDSEPSFTGAVLAANLDKG